VFVEVRKDFKNFIGISEKCLQVRAMPLFIIYLDIASNTTRHCS
jgi:hypothetical protein